ncbi:hypothetical protein [Aliiglaciecola sp. NS0011-25]|uniref:hypothetical protein n=1 Tax=Aliiglaciecola sp. NS0011-25 TaxID=3127654 RepID=UPI00310BB38A
MSKILQYPQFREVETLLTQNGFSLCEFNHEQLENLALTIQLLRRERGFFCPSLLVAMVSLLNHHWQPADLVALFPNGNSPHLVHLHD